MKPELIAILSDNKTALYEVNTDAGKGIFEAEIRGEAGNKYYNHKGIVCFLPSNFQGKVPKLILR